jgi:hypothetical protein
MWRNRSRLGKSVLQSSAAVNYLRFDSGRDSHRAMTKFDGDRQDDNRTRTFAAITGRNPCLMMTAAT